MDRVAQAKELLKVTRQIEKVEAILAKLRERKSELLHDLGET